MEVKVVRNKATYDGLNELVTGTDKVGKVGWPAGAIHVDPETGEIQEVATSALLNEFGYIKPSPSGLTMVKIPARPFLRNTVRREQAAWASAMQEGAKAVLDNKIQFDKVLDTVGKQAVSDIKDTIRSRVEPELAPYTLAKRRKSGNKSDLPLEDTGVLINTLDNEVTTE